MRTVKVFEEAWPLHTPFVIARGSRSEARVVVVELEEEGIKGTGECTPYPRYGESDASVMAQIMSVVPQLEKGLTREELQKILPAGAARNALDCALWDLAARKQQQSLADLIGITLPETVTTAQTIVIGTPDQMANSASTLWQAGAKLLKVKLDNHLISERMVAIRTAVPDATLIVDANESWRAEGLAARCQLLADLGVAMLEQPLPAQDDAALENFIHPILTFATLTRIVSASESAVSSGVLGSNKTNSSPPQRNTKSPLRAQLSRVRARAHNTSSPLECP